MYIDEGKIMKKEKMANQEIEKRIDRVFNRRISSAKEFSSAKRIPKQAHFAQENNGKKE